MPNDLPLVAEIVEGCGTTINSCALEPRSPNPRAKTAYGGSALGLFIFFSDRQSRLRSPSPLHIRRLTPYYTFFPARWNPHRSPSLPRPDVGVLSTTDAGTGTCATTSRAGGASALSGDVRQSGPGPRRSTERGRERAAEVRVLAQASLPRSCGLSLDQVNYLMVDYLVGQPPLSGREDRDRGEGGAGAADAREGSRLGTGAELMVFVNDPGRSGSPVLSLKLDMWRLIELGG